MGYRSLRFHNFRNIRDGVLAVDAPEVFLIGENGQGKTNLLEAIYLLSFGSSFRTRRDDTVVRHGETEMAVGGVFGREDLPDQEIAVRVREKKKEIRLDGKTLRDRREMVERFPCVVFCHGDIGFISGAPERQRTFFDQTLSLEDPLFIDTLRRYGKLLKQRNAAVKNRDGEMIDLFDGDFIDTGIEMTRRREALTEKFSAFFSRLYREVSSLEVPVGIRYLPSWRSSDPGEVRNELKKKRDADFQFSTTTSGPHRDRFRFLFGGRDFSAAASTGQIRLASLVLKAAQAAFFTSQTGRLPTILLDDVLLEMDPPRRQRFIARFPPYRQAFFTFLPDERFSAYAKGDTLIYRVREGGFFNE